MRSYLFIRLFVAFHFISFQASVYCTFLSDPEIVRSYSSKNLSEIWTFLNHVLKKPKKLPHHLEQKAYILLNKEKIEHLTQSIITASRL